MYDKTVRRRRAVLALLVASSLILLTAYFGESAGGALHGVQRGASEVLNPIQDGASRSLKPVRDLLGWFGDTVGAKGQVSDLRAERDTLRRELAREDGATVENARLRRLVQLDSSLRLNQYGLRTGRVIAQSPTVWYATIRVNQGSSDGVRVGQPVINEEALIGKVTEVFSGSAQVTLITDATSSVTAKTSRLGTFGIVTPASAGSPNDLVLKFAPTGARLQLGDRVVTRGTVSETQRLNSLFPPDLPIGEISRIDNAGTDTQEVHVRPFANMRSLDFVQILTRPRGGGGT
ncbi:MAG: rod shape-determining protein MreC [Actinomycetota bacterium]|nr:rod shape-determining protein MreC [Actinomycetota bacterium]